MALNLNSRLNPYHSPDFHFIRNWISISLYTLNIYPHLWLSLCHSLIYTIQLALIITRALVPISLPNPKFQPHSTVRYDFSLNSRQFYAIFFNFLSIHAVKSNTICNCSFHHERRKVQGWIEESWD
jgi:hypothetical protein